MSQPVGLGPRAHRRMAIHLLSVLALLAVVGGAVAFTIGGCGSAESAAAVVLTTPLPEVSPCTVAPHTGRHAVVAAAPELLVTGRVAVLLPPAESWTPLGPSRGVPPEHRAAPPVPPPNPAAL